MGVLKKCLLASVVLLVLSSCECTSPTEVPEEKPPQDPLLLEIASGNDQTARISEALAAPPTVRVRRQSGTPVSGIQVTFSVIAGGGSVAMTSTTTNASGLADPGSWTLGRQAGPNALSASAQGVTGPVTFSATGRLPYWTLLLYLAADNDLSFFGLGDIEELESVGPHPDVQVAVLGEFSPMVQLLSGCWLDCLNLSSWDTFLYVLDAENTKRFGIDGRVAYQGNRDMSSPATLAAFVAWGVNNLPAQHYLLIPWNHGGGYTGLIQDMTSAGSELMTLQELSQALSAAPPVDVIDFDMCLMGGYETLLSLDGKVDFAVFSEAVEPGEGNPFDLILTAMHMNPRRTPREVAGMLAQAFDLSYAGKRPSTTKSAYALAGLPEARAKVNALAALLAPRVASLRVPIQRALGRTTKFEMPVLTDIGDFSAQLGLEDVGSEVSTALSELRSAVIGGDFRVSSYARNGTGATAPDYARATGLHFVFPSGEGDDAFLSAGARSFAHYSTNYPTSEWTSFLGSWIQGLTTLPSSDLGDRQLMFQVWDTATSNRGGDVDFWIVEPSGEIYIPWLGVVTPNGTFSGDSYEEDPPLFYEGYTSNRVVEAGEYRIYAHRWTDPLGGSTYLDLAYRWLSDSEWNYLYTGNGGDPILLDGSSPIEADPTPTFSEADAGAYSNFRPLATWTVRSQTPERSGADWAAGASSAPVRVEAGALLKLLEGVSQIRNRSGTFWSVAREGGYVLPPIGVPSG